ncbi:MAG: hypothetical protein P8101_21575 [Candidatus Thiodiazotropha sp.]
MNHHALHTGRLVLTPVSPYAALEDHAPLIAMLREIALIDSAILPHTNRFLLGENFMQWINFMGCSPFIRMEPGEDNEPYCHLIIDGPTPHPRLLAGRNTTPPRCANCRKRLIDWRHTFASWEEASPGWLATCPHCGQTQDPVTYDFRQTAGCGPSNRRLRTTVPIHREHFSPGSHPLSEPAPISEKGLRQPDMGLFLPAGMTQYA